MTIYYLDPDLGSDLNDGTVGTPVKTLERVSEYSFSAGDVTVLADSTLRDPIRGELRPEAAGTAGSPITFRGDSVVASSYNLTPGAEFSIIDKHYATRAGTDRNIWFNDFTAGVIDFWSRVGVTANIVENNSDQLSGLAGCVELDSVGGTCYLRGSLFWSNLPTRFKIIYKTSADGVFSLDIRSDGDSQYAQLDSAGNFTGFSPTLSRPALAATTEWAEWETEAISRDFGNAKPNRVQMFSAGGGKVYIQNIALTAQAVWTVHDAANNVHKIELPVFQNIAHVAAYCTADEWEDSNWSALTYLIEADSLAEIQAGSQPNKSYLHTDGALYIQLPSGVDINDLHIECFTGAFGAGYITADHTSLVGLSFCGGKSYGLSNEAICATENVTCSFNRGSGLKDDGASAVGTHSKLAANSNGRAFYTDFSYPGPLSANGLITLDGATTTATGCVARSNGDDGFQNDAAGSLTLIGCLADSNESEQMSISSGDFVAQNCTFAAGSKEVYLSHVVFNDRSDIGTNDADYTRSIVDCYFPDVSGASAVRIGTDNAGNVTASGNIVIGSISDNTVAQTFTNQVNLVTSDPAGLDSDFIPSAGSVALGAGSKWWAGVRPASANGEPYTDVNADKGGLQSTRSVTHPANL